MKSFYRPGGIVATLALAMLVRVGEPAHGDISQNVLEGTGGC